MFIARLISRFSNDSIFHNVLPPVRFEVSADNGKESREELLNFKSPRPATKLDFTYVGLIGHCAAL